MSRRVRTLAVAGALFVVLFVLAFTLPVPYVVLSPGPTFNTLGTDDRGDQIIVINGRAANHTTGNLNMTTVDVSTQPLSAFSALEGWLLHDEVVVPKSSIYPPGQSQNQVNAQNASDFAESQDDAIAASCSELGYPSQFGVVTVDGSSPAHGSLHPGDRLVSLDGTAVSTSAGLVALLSKDAPGQRVSLAIVRAGKPMTVTLTLAHSSAHAGGYIGMNVGPVCAMPFTVDLGLGNRDRGTVGRAHVRPRDRGQGRHRRSHQGHVHRGHRHDRPDRQGRPDRWHRPEDDRGSPQGCDDLPCTDGQLCRRQGCDPQRMDVVKVATLHEAVQDLLALQAGSAVPHC